MTIPTYNSEYPEQYLTDLEQVLVPLIERIDNYEGIENPSNSFFSQILAPSEKPLCCKPCGVGSGSTSCTPTDFEFEPTYVSEVATQYVLKYSLDIAGAVTENAVIINAGTLTSPAAVARALFLDSTNDLMRQHWVRDHFAYSPYDVLNPGDTIWLSGYPANEADYSGPPLFNHEWVTQSITLTLKRALVLSEGQVCYVTAQFGEDVVLHSCASVFNIGE